MADLKSLPKLELIRILLYFAVTLFGDIDNII